MTLLSKNELKKTFEGLSSIYLKKGELADFATLDFDFDLPITVDSLNFSVAEPTINRTKVHGLASDWCITSTAGEVSFSATVPSMDDDLLSYFLGEGTAVAASTLNGTAGWAGKSYKLETTKLVVGLALMNEDKDKLFVIKKLALYATPIFENSSTTPFAFKLTGSIEASDSAGDAVAFLEKA